MFKIAFLVRCPGPVISLSHVGKSQGRIERRENNKEMANLVFLPKYLKGERYSRLRRMTYRELGCH